MTQPNGHLDLKPDPARVIARLSGRIAELESENAQLHDVVGQLLEERNTAAREADKAQAEKNTP